MAEQRQISSLAKRLGAKLVDAHKQHKDTPAQVGQARLPAGIDNGIAQLDSAKIGEYKEGENKGQSFFMAAGVVHEPKVFEGISIEGRRTTLGPIPLCDTPKAQGKKKTFADHYEDFINFFKLFDVTQPPNQLPNETKEAAAVRIESYLMAAMEQLVKDKPYFAFETWKGKATTAFPNPRTNERWGKVCSYAGSDGPVGMNGMVDHTLPPDGLPPVADHLDPPPGPNAVDVDQAEPSSAIHSPSPSEDQDQTTGAEEEVNIEGLSIDQLAEIADADPNGETEQGKAACQELGRLAKENGFTDADVNQAASWTVVGEMAMQPEQPKVPPPPTKGGIYKYVLKDASGKPLLGKDKKPRPPLDVEVTAVNLKNSTVNVKTKDGKPLIGADKKPVNIAFADLQIG